MQKSIKKFVLYNLENLKLSKTKFYCFYPLQSNASNERVVSRVAKVCFSKYRNLNFIKFPLKLKKFDNSKKLFLSLKSFNVVYIRYKNFCCSSNTQFFDRYFNVNYNFNLFVKSVASILSIYIFFKNLEKSFLSVVVLSFSRD